MSDLPPARLAVLTASASANAVIFRRGPSYATLSIGWDRDRHTFEIGQWLIGKVYSDRSDMSPNGNHMVYFAGTGRRGWWTAVSDAPWLTARIFSPQRGTCYGGGAFAPSGGLLLTTRENADIGSFKSASVADFPTPDLTSAKLIMRGWTPPPEAGTPTIYTKILGREWDLRCSLGYAPPNTLRFGYALFNRKSSELEVRPDWEWAERWKDHLQVAMSGGIHHAKLNSSGEPRDLSLLRDFSDMIYERRPPPDWVARNAVPRQRRGDSASP